MARLFFFDLQVFWCNLSLAAEDGWVPDAGLGTFSALHPEACAELVLPGLGADQPCADQR